MIVVRRVVFLPPFGIKVTATRHVPERTPTMALPRNVHRVPPETIEMRMRPCEVFGTFIATAAAMDDADTLRPRRTASERITTFCDVATTFVTDEFVSGTDDGVVDVEPVEVPGVDVVGDDG